MFGCAAYAHILDTQRKKLDKKAEKLRFVGYSIQSKAYQLLDDKTSKFYIRRDIVFNEKDFGHLPRKEESEVEGSTEQSEQTRPQEVRCSERTRQPPIRYGIDEYAVIYYSSSVIKCVSNHGTLRH